MTEWKKVPSRRDENGEPVFSHVREGNLGQIVIDYSGEWYTLRYGVHPGADKDGDGWAYRVGGKHRRYKTLEEAKEASNHANTMDPPR